MLLNINMVIIFDLSESIMLFDDPIPWGGCCIIFILLKTYTVTFLYFFAGKIDFLIAIVR